MDRLRYVIVAVALAGFAPGCGGEEQPNAPAAPSEVNEDFAKKTADMMKAANAGMDPKKLKLAPGAQRPNVPK
jgi:hypothetical protein